MGRKTGIAYRLGWALYWFCLVLAVVWVLGVLFLNTEGAVTEPFSVFVQRLEEDPLLVVLGLVGPVAALYAVGRAVRYVLSGE
ncbi:hypothetical protein [Methyloceanibacter sp.]|jgi:hypothetical protein|uniref:hypothetical protein n=1 Tax=Methyloceanibacter sp. TaxID=1965321 RepID=UPI003568E4D0